MKNVIILILVILLLLSISIHEVGFLKALIILVVLEKVVPIILLVVLSVVLVISIYKFIKRPTIQPLLDVNTNGDFFSFSEGIVKEDEAWDLMLNLPKGLAANNSELNNSFQQVNHSFCH